MAVYLGHYLAVLKFKPNQYEKSLLDLLGLQHFDTEWMRLIDHLLYLGESRYLLAWDNQIQSELITLLFQDLNLYQKTMLLWQQTMSLDSQWRNLRSQRVAQERNLEEMKSSNGGRLCGSSRPTRKITSS